MHLLNTKIKKNQELIYFEHGPDDLARVSCRSAEAWPCHWAQLGAICSLFGACTPCRDCRRFGLYVDINLWFFWIKCFICKIHHTCKVRDCLSDNQVPYLYIHTRVHVYYHVCMHVLCTYVCDILSRWGRLTAGMSCSSHRAPSQRGQCKLLRLRSRWLYPAHHIDICIHNSKCCY